MLQKSVDNATDIEISKWTWDEKYRYYKNDGTTTENTIEDTNKRIVNGIYAKDKHKNKYAPLALKAMNEFIWAPAGRIHAGAGTDKRVTLLNCYINSTVQDSLDTIKGQEGVGIMEAVRISAVTQQMGGGIGTGFSPIRPNGAIVKRTHSVSSGVLPFMEVFDATCATIKSAGHRRGALMGTLRIDHPDAPAFIKYKQTSGKLTNFNISLLITDKFMEAVKNDTDFDLYFNVPRADSNHVGVFVDENGVTQYIYDRVKAREMWNDLIKSTFEFSEPGIIFIDRYNKMNNLWYCEKIEATNPCGEQGMPPNGACDLGGINLAELVSNPFTDNAKFLYNLYKQTIHTGVRFLDNVLDVSLFPTKAQQIEAKNKRRIGLGITGLGNMLQFMKLVYGSDESLDLIEKVMTVHRDEAYRASINLAKERGPFPLFNRDKYLQGEFIKTLPEDIKEGIYQHGIRNGVLLTVAPMGTVSMYYKNTSSGCEPTIARTFKRKIREADGTYREFKEISDYGYYKYKEITGHRDGDPLPDYMCSALVAPLVTVEQHIMVQATLQKYIDSSISKTVNCPSDMKFEDFKNVYELAYDLGCKGCTTYKPSDVRGSVISVEEKKPEKHEINQLFVEPRPEELQGFTYKVKYPGVEYAFYITINNYELNGKLHPFEIFVNTKSVTHHEWIVALTRMISAIFRRGGDVTFIVEELQQVFSPQGGAFVKKKYIPSLAAMIGTVIEEHFIKIGLINDGTNIVPVNTKVVTEITNQPTISGAVCPQCQAPTLIKSEGCEKCASCDYSKCG